MSDVLAKLQRVAQIIPEGHFKDTLKPLLCPIRNHLNARSNLGKPEYLTTNIVVLVHDHMRWGKLGKYIWLSRRLRGYTRGAEAVALARASHSLPEGAVIVEIGAFLGCSAVLLAGARRLRGSGKVHCIDPFDASGDTFSAPFYRSTCDSLGVSLRQCFDANIRLAGLSEWVEVHQGRDLEVVATWSAPIDLLFLSGDQSYESVKNTYERWIPFLKPGGVIAVQNSAPGKYHESHDGSMRIVSELIHPPQYREICLIGSTTFARKAA
jgi:hypothetical protein